MEPQIQFCTSADGTRIAYATVGSGPPLVVVAGWADNLELEWQHPLGRAFLEGLGRGRLLVRFDRRGVGASQREVGDLSLEAQVADLAAVVDQLRLERFDLVAWGESGAMAVAYAAQNPERLWRLVLWSPYPRGEDAVRPEAVQGVLDLIPRNWSLARRAIADILFPTGPTELQRSFSYMVRESVSPETAARHVQFFATVDVRAYLPQVKAPTLVLHRRGDRNVPLAAGRAAAALIPDARLAVLEGNSPMPWVDMEPVLAAIDEFLGEGEEPVPATAPPGLVTILFTDVEGSTALTQRLGDAKAREVLREHERMVREALRSHGGAELKTMGDGFMASFGSATKALECAIAIQRAFEERNAGVGAALAPPIRVRIGLNAGEPIAEEDDLFGTAVTLAARIAAQAQGGEILTSDTVRGLVAGKRFPFADRGEVALKGFQEPVRLYEVRWQEEGATEGQA